MIVGVPSVAVVDHRIARHGRVAHALSTPSVEAAHAYTHDEASTVAMMVVVMVT